MNKLVWFLFFLFNSICFCSADNSHMIFLACQDVKRCYEIKNYLSSTLILGKIRTSCTCADVKYLKSGSAAWQNASINTVNTYDQYKRLTNITVNGENVYGYTLNDKNQRTSATLPDGNKWNYTYDVMGQLTGAVKQDTANNPLVNMNYFYDLIGNRTSATENSATTTYASNLVNQYTAVNAVVPVYDLDGNMTNYNGWAYTYNGENRLIVAENAAAGVRVEADYDYMGRRLFKKVYNNNTLTKHSLFVYDGFKQIAEFDALNNNSLKASYLWQPIGLDVVLLRNSEYLIADGNKNIIQVRNATGNVTDSYIYDPFGKVTHNGSSENPFQFSSEFFDSETELVYYNYRYYNPNLGRWIFRDPIQEIGGVNLYVISNNSLVGEFDHLGLEVLSVRGMALVYDPSTGRFREPKGSEKGRPGSFISKEEAKKRIANFSLEEKKKFSNAFWEFLQTDSPYKIKIDTVTGIIKDFSCALVGGAQEFAQNKFCLQALRNFKNARTVRDCHCAKESSKECVAEVALAMGSIGLTGGAIYIYGEELLDGFFDKLCIDCVKYRSRK